MRLTHQTNYSIRALLYCAENEGKPSRIRDIAKTYSISELHLFKIMHVLVENGLVETMRGRNGGIRLARPADKITLGEVVRATEGNFQLSDCFDPDHDCPLIDACGLSTALREALAAFLKVLDGYTIADVLAQPESLAGLIDLTAAEETGGRARAKARVRDAAR